MVEAEETRASEVSAGSARLALLAASTCLLFAGLGSELAAQDFARVAPYRDIVWEDDQARVLVGERWYDWLAVDGIPVDSLESASRARWGGLWEKRIAEDLVEVMALLDRSPGLTVDLTVRDSTIVRVLEAVPMTDSNRAAVLRARRARENVASRPQPLTRATALEDLAFLQRALEQGFAYLRTGSVDVEAVIEGAADEIGSEPEPTSFALRIQEVLSHFIDGHAGVSGFTPVPGYLSFTLEPTGDGWTAVRPDRSDLLDPEHPYVVALDGVPIERWAESARGLIPNGSDALVRDETARWLRSVGLFRGRLGLRQTDSVAVQLESSTGSSRTILTAVSSRLPIRGPWPRRGSGLLEGGIGYLRLPVMDGNAVEEVRRWMPRFADAPGLVIDVRGNGGGSREALRELLPYVLDPGLGPRVVNIAAYRTHAAYPEGHLANRGLFRVDDPRWTDDERTAIHNAAEAFRPEWVPPEEEFSDWHYLVLSPSSDSATRYDGPVVVLLDQRAFSATDIFLGAFADLTDAALVGAPSRGGSARAIVIQLPNSRLSVRFASMASFRPDGRLYDGRGVEPDVVVELPPRYYVLDGPDPILEKALEILAGR